MQKYLLKQKKIKEKNNNNLNDAKSKKEKSDNKINNDCKGLKLNENEEE